MLGNTTRSQMQPCQILTDDKTSNICSYRLQLIGIILYFEFIKVKLPKKILYYVPSL